MRARIPFCVGLWRRRAPSRLIWHVGLARVPMLYLPRATRKSSAAIEKHGATGLSRVVPCYTAGAYAVILWWPTRKGHVSDRAMRRRTLTQADCQANSDRLAEVFALISPDIIGTVHRGRHVVKKFRSTCSHTKWPTEIVHTPIAASVEGCVTRHRRMSDGTSHPILPSFPAFFLRSGKRSMPYDMCTKRCERGASTIGIHGGDAGWWLWPISLCLLRHFRLSV